MVVNSPKDVLNAETFLRAIEVSKLFTLTPLKCVDFIMLKMVSLKLKPTIRCSFF
jgi:hypothetical protein